MKLSKTYQSKDYEDRIYQEWLAEDVFNPDTCIKKGITSEKAEHFSMVLPPPNVTGTLHMGHAAMLAIEDVMVRYNRMQGKRTLWLPGTDHAAIATQSKVEKILFDETGQTRHDLGREQFLKKVDEFAQNSHDTIVGQAKKMGSSLDWSREAFTLDKQRNLAVKTVFEKMYKDGIIYRGDRIVNWDPKMQSNVSDDEMERVEEKTEFYYLKYGPFTIGTARPETKFGDKYVVMHPDDERYAEYKHGQKIELEWINGPVTATIIKDKAVDPKFGTGVMTITPWHDVTDFEIAQRHNLSYEQIIDENGKLMEIAQEFAGQDIFDARPRIVNKLKEKGLLVKIDKDYVHSIAKNYRGGGIIEPQIRTQWFINVNKKFTLPHSNINGIKSGDKVTLKQLMQTVVKNGQIKIIPENFEKIYFYWIDNLRDWCISRQIWYGHRIPVWYKGDEIYVGVDAPQGDGWQQDPDTLDTWFSSGLWTFSTMGYPDTNAPDMKNYHPTTVMETGYDIIFFWVARMILMTTYTLGDIPFKYVYLHGMVRDEKGTKMSKSLGNVIDPLDMIERFGADATRLSLMIGTTPGNDLKLSESKVAGYRNFVNKLWNISRYIIMTVKEVKHIETEPKAKTIADEWILSELNQLIQNTTQDIDKFNFSQAGEKLYDFTWNKLADWYVEFVKKIETDEDDILLFVLGTLLKLWHPFMPFVTEVIWKNFSTDNQLVITKWPKVSNDKRNNFQFKQKQNTKIQPPIINIDNRANNEQIPIVTSDANFKKLKNKNIVVIERNTTTQFINLQTIISNIRTLRVNAGITAGAKTKVILTTTHKNLNDLVQEYKDVIEKMTKTELELTTKKPTADDLASIHESSFSLFVAISTAVKNKQAGEKKNLEKYITTLKNKLASDFAKKAPEEIVEQEKEKLKQAEEKLNKML